MNKAHDAIDNLITSASLHRFQEGGQVQKQSIEDILKKNQKLNFVQRILNPELNFGKEFYFQDDSLKRRPATHYMIQYDNRVAPTVVDTGGNKLVYLGDNAISYADSTGEYIEFKTPEEALLFSKNYKNYAPFRKAYK